MDMPQAQILVVEDESIVAKAIQRRLTSLGYVVPGVAASGEEAVQKANQMHPDLVLMDIVLKGAMDGMEAASQIRSHLNIPVVYLTAYTDDDTLQRAKRTEPFGYILKPFEERELQTTIEMALYRHQMEMKLRESEQWLATTLKSIGDAVITADQQGRITLMNPIAEALTGWKQEEALGQDWTHVFTILGERNWTLRDNPVTRAWGEGSPVGPSTHTLAAKDGTKRPIDANVAPIRDDKGMIAGVVVVFRDITERKRAEEALQRAKEELSLRVEERTAELQQLNQQLLRDIAERKRAEEALRQSERQLRQAQKMEAVGRLAGGVAHDFNHLLMLIAGYNEELLTSFHPSDPRRRDGEEIRKAVEQAAALTRQLLAFSRRQVLAPQVLDLNAVVANLEQMLHRLLGETTRVEIALGPGLGHVQGDPGHFEQVIMNLAVNARDAMPEGGTLTIRTSNVQVDGAHALRHSGISPGPYVLLTVRDTGCGMDGEILSNIFEPFFTTKEPGKGTGLGLSIVYSIVSQSDGYIDVESAPGQGTTFLIYFPRVRDYD
jgi:PAS domain S-box-containing protein